MRVFIAFCFNSPLGILVVRTFAAVASAGHRWDSFNSPLGILVVRTIQSGSYSNSLEMFQFPARNSGCSDPTRACGRRWIWAVSIPRSEFWLFGPGSDEPGTTATPQVSIPRSEFWLFGLRSRGLTNSKRRVFQFPARNSGCSDEMVGMIVIGLPCGFNSPLGILVVRTHGQAAADARHHNGFNSPLGILVVRT